MCPQCNAKCDYWYLNETCIYSRISSLFDNNLTIYFAVFMSFWGNSWYLSFFQVLTWFIFAATLYLELWKRYSVNLIHRWGLTDYCHRAEHPRPQYLAQFRTQKKTKFNEIHRILEPNVPFWKVKFPRYLISYSIVFLFVSTDTRILPVISRLNVSNININFISHFLFIYICLFRYALQLPPSSVLLFTECRQIPRKISMGTQTQCHTKSWYYQRQQL